MDHLVRHTLDMLRGVALYVGEADPRTHAVFDQEDPPQVVSTGIDLPIGSLYLRVATGADPQQLSTLPSFHIKVGPKPWQWARIGLSYIEERVPDGQGGFLPTFQLEASPPISEATP